MADTIEDRKGILIIDGDYLEAHGEMRAAKTEALLFTTALEKIWSLADIYVNLNLETHMPSISRHDVRGRPDIQYLTPAQARKGLCNGTIPTPRVIVVSDRCYETGYGDAVGVSLLESAPAVVPVVPVVSVWKMWHESGEIVTGAHDPKELKAALMTYDFINAVASALVYNNSSHSPQLVRRLRAKDQSGLSLK